MKTISTVSNVKKSPQSAPEPVSKVRAVLRELVEICPHPARLLELYYWSAEPELLETLHRYIGFAGAATRGIARVLDHGRGLP